MRHSSRQATRRGESTKALDRLGDAPGRPAAHELVDRRAEQARCNEQAFRDLVVRGWDGALVLDKHGYVRFMNEAAKQILGPQSERLVGANFGLPAVGRRGVEIEIARAPGDDRIAEMRVVDGPWDGERARIVLIRDVTETRSNGDEGVCLTRAFRGITKALTVADGTETAGEDLAQRLCGAILEYAPSTQTHVYLTSSSGDLIHVARAGVEAAEGARPARFSPIEIEGLLDDAWDSPIAGIASGAGHPFVARLAARMRLGWLLVTPLEHEGRTIGLQMTGGEASGPQITTKRIVEEASRVAGLAIGSALLRSEIRDLERARSEILSMVSHELRSPLHVILGYENLLLDGGLGELTSEQHDAMVRIGRNARQLADLIENTLTASRESASSLPHGTREVRPCEVILDIREEMTTLYGDKPLELRWDVAEDLPRVYTEPDKLKIIVRNLVANAVKFTDRGSVEITAERRDGGLAITVTDTGVGIPADQLETIFEEFRQVSPSDSDTRGGVGLGLYIVRRMAEKLEGKVSVTSEEGVGSSFTIWIPLRVGAIHAAA